MTDVPDTVATETVLTPRRLVVAALVVAALASIVASLILWPVMVFVTSGDSQAPRSATCPK